MAAGGTSLQGPAAVSLRARHAVARAASWTKAPKAGRRLILHARMLALAAPAPASSSSAAASGAARGGPPGRSFLENPLARPAREGAVG